MKTLIDRSGALAQGLDAIRQDFDLPDGFPPDVTLAASKAVDRPLSDHVDRTAIPFVTLDPASSTDLDQAFAISRTSSGESGDILLHYAIADVGWFVADGDQVDREAWTRGTTQYLPDGRVSLYPPCLSEDAASLLPTGDRSAIIFHVRVHGDGDVTLDDVERAVVRSRAKLAYDQVTPADLPDGFAEIARRIRGAEAARGAARVDPPEQEVERLANGHYALRFRPRLQSEEDNAALSLATNMAVAKAFIAAKTGLFRVMPGPSDRAVARLRQTAAAFGIDWQAKLSLTDFQRGLDDTDPAQAAMMLAIRRAGEGARYAPFDPDDPPFHTAIAAPYAHATAPLRRLADRHVVETALALANGQPVPDACNAAFHRLPKVMARADATGGQIYRAVLDLAEALILADNVGENFDAVVTDVTDRYVRFQLCDVAVIARTSLPPGSVAAAPGDALRLKLRAVNIPARTVDFAPV